MKISESKVYGLIAIFALLIAVDSEIGLFRAPRLRTQEVNHAIAGGESAPNSEKGRNSDIENLQRRISAIEQRLAGDSSDRTLEELSKSIEYVANQSAKNVRMTEEISRNLGKELKGRNDAYKILYDQIGQIRDELKSKTESR